jgi:hypothetical protein
VSFLLVRKKANGLKSRVARLASPMEEQPALKGDELAHLHGHDLLEDGEEYHDGEEEEEEYESQEEQEAAEHIKRVDSNADVFERDSDEEEARQRELEDAVVAEAEAQVSVRSSFGSLTLALPGRA